MTDQRWHRGQIPSRGRAALAGRGPGYLGFTVLWAILSHLPNGSYASGPGRVQGPSPGNERCQRSRPESSGRREPLGAE